MFYIHIYGYIPALFKFHKISSLIIFNCYYFQFDIFLLLQPMGNSRINYFIRLEEIPCSVSILFLRAINPIFPDLKKQFESPPYSVSVEAGQSTELRCLPPVGVPPPRVYWLRNNVPVDTESDTLLVSSEGHLLVGQAKLSHQANYTCVAENIAAKRLSEPVSLTVYGEFLLLTFNLLYVYIVVDKIK